MSSKKKSTTIRRRGKRKFNISKHRLRRRDLHRRTKGERMRFTTVRGPNLKVRKPVKVCLRERVDLDKPSEIESASRGREG